MIEISLSVFGDIPDRGERMRAVIGTVSDTRPGEMSETDSKRKTLDLGSHEAVKFLMPLVTESLEFEM